VFGGTPVKGRFDGLQVYSNIQSAMFLLQPFMISQYNHIQWKAKSHVFCLFSFMRNCGFTPSVVLRIHTHTYVAGFYYQLLTFCWGECSLRCMLIFTAEKTNDQNLWLKIQIQNDDTSKYVRNWFYIGVLLLCRDLKAPNAKHLYIFVEGYAMCDSTWR